MKQTVIKSVTIKCSILVVLIIIYEILEYILRINNLAFRNIIFYTFIVSCVILSFLIFIQVIKALYNTTKKKTLKIYVRIISGIGSGIITILMTALLIYGTFIFIFAHRPEHVVEKDGKKMVAYVDSFLEVKVNYYKYVNLLVRGNQLKINEYYGNGGYDPFERDEMPTVKSQIYFDDNGEVIKSNR